MPSEHQSPHLVLASANPKKIKELKELLLGFDILSTKEIGFDKEIEEPYFTFEENAHQKAFTIHQFCGKNVLADDSGISVEAMNGAPGVMSARYAGPQANDQDNLNKMLHEMRGESNRRAWYTAVLCLVWEGSVYYFKGECYGKLLLEARGQNGFGYDPIFVPDGYHQSFAELSPDIKKKISHRAKAMKALLAFLSGQK